MGRCPAPIQHCPIRHLDIPNRYRTCQRQFQPTINIMNKTQLTLIALTSLLFACKEKPKNTNPLGQPDIISVKVAPVSSFGITSTIQTTGLVSTENEANYAFKIGGVI